MIDLRHKVNGTAEVLTQFTRAGVTVEVGFVSDGASAPRFLWWIIPPFKRTAEAAVIHDYLCRKARNKDDRKKADILFHELLKEDLRDVYASGLKGQYNAFSSQIRAFCGYTGVRLGALLGIGKYY